MDNGFFLITGTSRGVGEALARKALDQGNTVLGISRSRSDRLDSARYHHLAFDLSDTSRMNLIMERVGDLVDDQNFDFVCLVNNASALEPVGAIEHCPPHEIRAHVTIGLIAPMILSSLFIQKFASAKIRKKVAFISSGAATTALPHESIYCGSKAGMNMFAQCVGLEQKDREYGFEVIAISPGMVETYMQQSVRAKTSDQFVLSDFFRQAFEDGKLKEPAEAAEKIYSVLQNRYEQGKFIRISEI